MITQWEVKAAILLAARTVLEKSHIHHSKKGKAYVEKQHERGVPRGRLHQVKPYERVADRIPVYRDSDVHKYMAQPRFNDGGVYTVSIGFQQMTVWRHKTPSAAGSFVSEYAQQQPGTYGYWQNGSFHRFSQAIEDMHRRKIQESAYTADR